VPRSPRRELTKYQRELLPAQIAFLDGVEEVEAWKTMDLLEGNRLSWLIAEDPDKPCRDSSMSARFLCNRYGDEALQEWTKHNPGVAHPQLQQLGPPKPEER
jgi:hypothetical protein